MSVGKKRYSHRQFHRDFDTEEKCIAFFEKNRWPDGVVCPFCEHTKIYSLSTKRTPYKCAKCKKKFNYKTKTFLENSKISILKWFDAIYCLTVRKKNMSSYELVEEIDVCQKTAWYMIIRIQEGYLRAQLPKFTGICEADECFAGGISVNRHYNKRVAHRPDADTFIDKIMVLGLLERKSKQIRLGVSLNRDTDTLTHFILNNVEISDKTVIITDMWRGYNELENYVQRETIDHDKYEYSREGVSTNAMEGTWTHVRKVVCGTHFNYVKKHMLSYLKMFQFRRNTITLTTKQRFKEYLQYLICEGPRLRFKDVKFAHTL